MPSGRCYNLPWNRTKQISLQSPSSPLLLCWWMQAVLSLMNYAFSFTFSSDLKLLFLIYWFELLQPLPHTSSASLSDIADTDSVVIECTDPRVDLGELQMNSPVGLSEVARNLNDIVPAGGTFSKSTESIKQHLSRFRHWTGLVVKSPAQVTH